MVTNAEQEEVQTPAEKREEVVRNVVAGHPQGAMRRIILYLIVGASLTTLIAFGGIPGVVVGTLGIIALLLLAMTDQLA